MEVRKGSGRLEGGRGHITLQGERLKNHLQQLQVNLTAVSAGQGFAHVLLERLQPLLTRQRRIWLHTHLLDY